VKASSAAVGEQMLDLADRISELSSAQWNSPSLCASWRIRDVVAHIVAGAEGAFGTGAVIAGLIRYRFNYDRWIAADGKARGQSDPAVILNALRVAAVTSKEATKAAPIRALAHVLIHGQDVCRPLGINRDLPEEHLVPVADFVARSVIFRAHKRIAGLRLSASDIDWSLGDGPEVRGPAEALVMMMAGRSVAIDELSGDGVTILRRGIDN
jgi:uncharacterized protein (TIGR03083 family)